MGHALIDNAAKLCGGSRYKLAKQLAYHEGQLSEIYNGKRPMPPGLAARLAAMTGQDARSAAAVALIEGARDEREREELQRAFFPATAAGVLGFTLAVLLVLWPTSDALASTSRDAHAIPTNRPVCILCKLTEVNDEARAAELHASAWQARSYRALPIRQSLQPVGAGQQALQAAPTDPRR